MTSPPRSQPPATAPSPYQSAYNRGFVSRPDGTFDHFIRKLDPSHIQTGYWKFISHEDDQRAYARGFWTPEEILVAQDRTDELYDDIKLHWVRGVGDPNTQIPLVGSAAEHLQTIYEVRRVLGLPLAFRGQLPVYPTDPSIRLKEYWDMKRSHQSTPMKLSISIPAPGSSPSNNAEESLPISTEPQHDQPSSPLHQPSNVIDSARYHQSTTAVSRGNPTNTPRPPTVSPLTPLKAPEPSNTESIANAPSELPRTKRSGSNNTRTPRSATGRAQQPNSGVIPSTSTHRADAPAVPQVQPVHAFQPPDLAPSRSFPADTDGRQHISPYDASPLSTRPSSRHSTTAAPSPYSPPSGSTSTSQPCSPSASNDLLPALSQDTKSSEASWNAQARTLIDSDSPQSQPSSKTLSPHPRLINRGHYTGASTTFTASPTGSVESARRFSHTRFAQEGIPVSPTNHSESTSVISRNKDATTRTQQSNQPSTTAEVNQTGLEKSRSMRTSEPKQSGFLSHGRNKSIVQEQLLSENVDMYPGLPCMECGQDQGHKLDCYVGNPKFMKTLTELDYRNLVDAVKRFDPGPWTTHFDQFPQPEPEDPEVQVQGMAEVIRNETSYKNDPELHKLPDDLMIMLWAFKTSPAVEVLDQDTWESSVRVSEVD